MLQHVLKEMRIDPELLAGLEEIEKETLFCCMREEQIRRWKEWDQKETEAIKSQPPRIKRIGVKSVKWLCDDSGEPIVSVIERSSEEDVTDTKETTPEYEQKELRLTIKNGCHIDLSTNESADKLSKYVNVASNNKNSSSSIIFNLSDRRGALQELSLNKVPKVARQVAEWEKRVMHDDSKASNKASIHDNNHSNNTNNANNKKSIEPALTNEIQQEQLWREQQKIANETQLRMRTIARLAREEHRRSLLIENHNEINRPNFTITNESSVSDMKKNFLKPPSNEAIVNWYRTKEFPKHAGLQSNKNAADWFHGLLSRKEAEDSLINEKEGTFLVRIADRLWSYTISCKTNEGVKHYLIDASNGTNYQLVISKHRSYHSLDDLISYYKTNPLIENSNEFLLHPCLKSRNLNTLFERSVA